MRSLVDFIVIGLPRSGTTWLANWLTTDRSVCLHDPFSLALPEEWSRDDRRFGVSCTGAYLFPNWLAAQKCPVAVIERDPMQCEVSLAAIGLGDPNDLQATTGLQHALSKVEGRRWRFEDIWNEEKAHEMWAFLLPGIPFDALRYRLLNEIQVQPHMSKWLFDPSIYREMQRREAGG